MVLVSVGAVIGSLGAAGLKAGAAHLKLDLRALLTNWRLALGIGLYLVSVVFYVKGISRGEISILFPFVSTGYIWSTIWSRLFFGENFSRAKFLGLGLILAGCVLLGLGRR